MRKISASLLIKEGTFGSDLASDRTEQIWDDSIEIWSRREMRNVGQKCRKITPELGEIQIEEMRIRMLSK